MFLEAGERDAPGADMPGPEELRSGEGEQQQRLQAKKQEINKPLHLPLRTQLMTPGETSDHLGGMGYGYMWLLGRGAHIQVLHQEGLIH